MLGAAANHLSPWFILPTAERVPAPVDLSCLGKTAAFSSLGPGRGQWAGRGPQGALG